MYNKQHGMCWICRIHQRKLTYRLFVDHNHETGKVRALLCSRCNTGLGYLEDEDFMIKAKEYLEKFNGNL